MKIASRRAPRIAAVLLTTLALGCKKETPAAPASALQEARNPPQAAVEGGSAALAALQQRLLQRLMQALSKGKLEGAVSACSEEAQALTAQVASEQGLELGRTSHRLRNPKNAPREWVKPWLEAWADKPAQTLKPVVVDLGEERIGLLRPIPMAGLCSGCHGPSESLSPEVKTLLAQAYPEDKAVGFKPGELRGVFWAEVPRSYVSKTAPQPAQAPEQPSQPQPAQAQPNQVQ